VPKGKMVTRTMVANCFVVPFGLSNQILAEELYEEEDLVVIVTKELGEIKAWRCTKALVEELLASDPVAVLFMTYKQVRGKMKLDEFQSRPPRNLHECLRDI
jgi:hypothetical protein